VLKDNAFWSAGTAAGEDHVCILLAFVVILGLISQLCRCAHSLSRYAEHQGSQAVSPFSKSRRTEQSMRLGEIE
jgi:hypothetical protein